MKLNNSLQNNNTNKNNNYNMLFVVGKIVFMHTQTPDTKFVFSSSDPVDCYVYGVLAISMKVCIEW
jgi:hypothetical protein